MPNLVASSRPRSWFLAILNSFVAVGAIVGGSMLALRPDGPWLRTPLSMLRYSPFRDYLAPALVLLVVIGCGSMIAATLAAFGQRWAPIASGVVASTLMVWMVAEMVMLHWMHALYFALGAAILLEALRVFRRWTRTRRTRRESGARKSRVPRCILITYGSKRAGTAQIGRIVGDTLERRGFQVDVLPPKLAGRAAMGEYDAVIVGGALYGGRWHREARRFVKRRVEELQSMPVWFFSSGPLDDSASREAIPPTKQVSRLMDTVGVRGHVTFGGRLKPNARGFPASAMARKRSGDWRDLERVRMWAKDVAYMLRPDLAKSRTQEAHVLVFRPRESVQKRAREDNSLEHSP